jgi:predicted metal-dependent hydrolase
MGKDAYGLANVMGDERYLAFISYFNTEQDYFECHEVMEELWLEEGRHPLLQGLLQAAVGLHHWHNDNFTGAVKLMDAGLAKLSAYADVVLGLDLARLREDLIASLAALAARPADAPFQAFELFVRDEQLVSAVADWEHEQRARRHGDLSS